MKNASHPAVSPAYLSRSGWNALLPPRPVATLDEDVECELAVVGAGYTGVAAARRWAELRGSDRVMILEASILGEGNPGRNSGFLLDVALAEDADAAARERMAASNRLIGAAMAEIRRLVEQSGECCGLVRRGTYRAAVSPAGLASLGRYRGFLDATGRDYAVLDRDALASRLGTRFYTEGLYSPDCYLAQPAALIRALADTLPENVMIAEHCPVEKLVRQAEGWSLQCGERRVRARHVILANNAFSAGLVDDAARIVAMYTYAGLTEPLSAAELAKLGSEEEWGLLPAHRLGSTLRRTADGRLLVRAFHGYEKEAEPDQIAAKLKDCLARRFPQIRLPEFVSTWSGATGYTHNGGPLWGGCGDNLWISAGCNGGGVVKGTLFGRALAELATGGRPPDISGLFGRASWLPPDPLRRWGYELSSRWQALQGAAEM